jgi:uncharacterized protein (TIGR02118 family)
MTYLLVQYGVPADAAEFDRYYRETHIPLAKTLPGLREYTISNGPVSPLAGTAPHLVALLSFESPEALQAAFASPEGQATAADLANFATGGVSMFAYQGKLA